MTVTLGQNISALRTQRELSSGERALGKVYERLATGQRINRASDDAAGLAVASSLGTDRRVFTQGVRNLNDGTSMLAIAESALGELTNIVTRIRELSTQAANGSYSSIQRSALDSEAQALSKEYTRIAKSTAFNGTKLFDGSVDVLSLQGGYGTSGSITSALGGAVGTGSFSVSQTLNAETLTSFETQFADIDNDGDNDLITLGAQVGYAGFFSVYLNNGDGSFAPVRSYEADAGYSTALVVYDFNNDGIMDVATSGIHPDTTGYISVRYGNGDGTFGAQMTAQNGLRYYASGSMDAGDINGDGLADIVTSSNISGYQGIAVNFGSADFTGHSVIDSFSGSSVYDVNLTDVDGDGKLDIVASGNWGGAGLRIYQGNGDGTFKAPVSYNVSASLQGSHIADVNGDGAPDIVANGFSGGFVFINNGKGTFSTVTSFRELWGGTASNSFVGDMNSDGIMDVGVVSTSGFTVAFGNGDGTFNAVRAGTNGGSATDVTIGDIDGDGVADLAETVYGSSANLRIFKNATKSGVAALDQFSLKTVSGAKSTMRAMDARLNILSRHRGQVGALQSRVNSAVRNLESATVNYTSAESSIRDADIATESSQLVRLQVLREAGSSMLAHSGTIAELALELLS